MEQLAAQRQRFMASAADPSPESNASTSTAADPSEERTPSPEKAKEREEKVKEEAKTEEACVQETKEYTCCHCLLAGPASEERPIGLVTLIQSSSVLAHKRLSGAPVNTTTTNSSVANDNLLSFLGAWFAHRAGAGAAAAAGRHTGVRVRGTIPGKNKPCLMSMNLFPIIIPWF